jgi:DnaK suppressor protein
VPLGDLLGRDREQTVVQIEALNQDLQDIASAGALVATDDEHDPEGATIAFERARVDALLNQARHHLVELDRAARRVADGSYGRCERCGAAIGAERLAALPATARCFECSGR